MRLNQIIALVQGKKTRASKMLTELYQGWKDKTSGLSRTYNPLFEDGEKFPPESKLVISSVPTALTPIKKEITDYFNIVATQETGNTTAKASIVVDGETIYSNVPVSVLLFLEKQLIDLRTMIAALPTLPEDKEWNWDDGKNCFVSRPEQTNKTQKVVEPIVKYPATPEHPAQTDLITKDKVVGTWTTVHLSGALPKTKKESYLNQVDKLSEAVKIAREEANSIEVKIDASFGESLVGYIFKS